MNPESFLSNFRGSYQFCPVFLLFKIREIKLVRRWNQPSPIFVQFVQPVYNKSYYNVTFE